MFEPTWGCLAEEVKDNLIHFASPVPDRGLMTWREKNKMPGKLKQKLGESSLEGWEGVIAQVTWQATGTEHPQRSRILSLSAQTTLNFWSFSKHVHVTFLKL